MTHVAMGHQAELAAADYLIHQGYEILHQNWRTRYCEVDIIARKNSTVYFVEVKYRLTANQGTGLDYITPKKLKQMAFGGEMWVQQYNWRAPYCLAAVEISGPAFEITNFVEI